MKRLFICTVIVVVFLLAGSLVAQQKATITGVPDIPFVAVPNFLKLPPGESLGESVAVATNSKGNIYVGEGADGKRVQRFLYKGLKAAR